MLLRALLSVPAPLARSGARGVSMLRRALAGRRLRRSAGRHRRDRWRAIRAEMAAAEPGHVFLAGDSHAELLGRPDFGRPVVNGGVGGIRTGAYARDLARLPAPPRAAVAVLIVGSNDTHRCDRPLSARRCRAFVADAGVLIERLQARSDAVVVVAVPPVSGPMADHRHLRAMAAYSAALESLCAARGAAFVDPFAAMRGRDPALASPETRMDPLGAHLADYAVLARALAPLVAAARPVHRHG